MSVGRRRLGASALGLLIAGLVGLAVWLADSARATIATGPSADFDALLDAAVAGLSAPVAGWLAVSLALSWWRVVRGLPAPRFTPARMHRVVGLLLGVTIAAAPLTAHASAATTVASVAVSIDPTWGAQTDVAGTDPTPGVDGRPGGATEAASPSTSRPTTATTTPSASAEGSPATNSPPADSASTSGWVPAIPPTTADPADPTVVGGQRPTADELSTVVVHRGDTLWDIAARHLDEGASAAEIAAAWPAWYEANRDVIGPDPDLILPGQQLQAPG